MVASVTCSCTLLAARDKLPFQIFILKESLASSNPKTAVVPQGPSHGVTRPGGAGTRRSPSPHGPGCSGNGGQAAPSRGAARWRCAVRALPSPGPAAAGGSGALRPAPLGWSRVRSSLSLLLRNLPGSDSSPKSSGLTPRRPHRGSRVRAGVPCSPRTEGDKRQAKIACRKDPGSCDSTGYVPR